MKYWIDLTGKLYLICDHLSHEEWANQYKNCSLEKLLFKNWIRIQYVPPEYVLIDYQKINQKQINSVKNLLNCKQIIIEVNNNPNNFNNSQKALEFMKN